MHRIICAPAIGLEVDHINGDGMDNRRKNLRAVTPSHNQMNQRLSLANNSGVKGVSWVASRNKWKAQTGMGGKTIFLGRFHNMEDAILAYDAATLLGRPIIGVDY